MNLLWIVLHTENFVNSFKFREKYDPKDWIFPKFCQYIQKNSKIVISKFRQKRKNQKAYVIPQLIFGGQGNSWGRRRTIAEINFHNFWKILWVQNLAKTATLTVYLLVSTLCKFVKFCLDLNIGWNATPHVL